MIVTGVDLPEFIQVAPTIRGACGLEIVPKNRFDRIFPAEPTALDRDLFARIEGTFNGRGHWAVDRITGAGASVAVQTGIAACVGEYHVAVCPSRRPSAPSCNSSAKRDAGCLLL